MSQVANSKAKDVGRSKYTSLNLNQTYKGSKGENKSTTGQAQRHGLQSLGKISQNRSRVLQPANLPSLKSENSGNDPRINLVPSGSQGWGKKESYVQNGKKRDIASTTTSGGQGKPAPPKQAEGQEISLRPNAGVVPAAKPPTGTVEAREAAKITWGSKVQPPQPPSGSSMYFQREFPRLGGDDGRGDDGKELDHTEKGGQDVNPQAMGHQAFMNGQKWMDEAGSPMPMPPNFPPQYSGERPMFNGQQPYPYPPYPMYPGPGGRSMPMPYPYPYPYPGPGGKMPPFDPRFFQRMGKPPFMGPTNSQSERPSVVKDTDLKSLDDETDDAGWAGAQEEVDYNAKLKFDESDDSDEENHRSSKRYDGSREKKHDDERNVNHKNQKPPEGWPEYPHGYPPQMQYGHQNWPRVPFPGYNPQRGPPPHGYPFHPMYFMTPYGFPQNMPPQANEKPEDVSKQDEKKDAKDTMLRSEDENEMKRKAAAQAKLKALEEIMKKRGEDKRRQESGQKYESKEASIEVGHSRSRNDSEASDSSRRSTTKEIPPRFQRQKSGQRNVSSPGADVKLNVENNRSGAESPQLTIMKRKDSIKSDDDTKDRVFKKPDVPTDKSFKEDNSDRRPSFERSNDQRSSRHGSSSSLYQETVKSEKQKRRSSDSYEKDKLPRHGSNSSVHNKEEDKKEGQDKSHARKELKDLSSAQNKNRESDKNFRGHDRQDKKKKDWLEDQISGKDFPHKSSESRKIDSQRFVDLKLSKGQSKQNKTARQEEEQPTTEKRDSREPKKTSPWSKVVSGENTPEKTTDAKKSLREIQKEEEEEENRKSQQVEDNPAQDENKDEKVDGKSTKNRNRLSPNDNKFRSDYYDKNEKKGGRYEKYNYEEKNDKGRPERRGRFDDSRRGGRYERDDRRDDKRDYNKNRDDGSGKLDNRYRKDDNRRDESRKDRREDANRIDANNEYKKDERRDESRKDDRRDDKHSLRRDEYKRERREDYRKDDKRDDRKGDTKKYEKRESSKQENTKDDVKTDQKKDEQLSKDGVREEYKKEGRRNQRKVGNNREDYKIDQRDDYKGNRRHDYKNDRRDDYKNERKDYNRSDRDGSKRYSDKHYYEDNRRSESGRRNDWSTRDYRQSEEYQKDVKEREERRKKQEEENKEKDGQKKDKDEHQTNKEDNEKKEISNMHSESGRRNDWSIRDYRQSEEYHKDIKESEERRKKQEEEKKEKDEQKKDKDEHQTNKENNEKEEISNIKKIEITTEKSETAVADENIEHVDKIEKDSKANEPKSQHVQVTDDEAKTAPEAVESTDGKAKEEKSKSGESSEKTAIEGKPKDFAGFGSPDKPRKERADNKCERSFKHDNREESRNYRGRDDSSYNRGRDSGRGRRGGYSSRGSSSSSKSQRLPSGRQNRPSKSRDAHSSKDQNYDLEDVSSGEFSDESPFKGEKPMVKATSHKGTAKKPDHIKNWESERPPRFQNKYQSQERDGYRGRGTSSRVWGRGGERGRGRGRGRDLHLSQYGNRGYRGAEKKPNDDKNEDDSAEDYYYSAEESTPSFSPEEIAGFNTETEKHKKSDYRANSINRDKGYKSRVRGGAYLPERVSRGSARSSQGSRSDSPFLANWQQVENKRTSIENDKALPAAEKSESKDFEVQLNVKTPDHVLKNSNLEDISAHSPPKKVKPTVEKRDIAREFDLNNIASVVCIDDIMTNFDQQNTKPMEEDGFVTVTSKKQQKELRDRQRDEEKRKILMEQKREAIAASKAQKAARKEIQKNAVVNGAKTQPISFVDAPISSAAVEQVPASTIPVTTSASQAPASNVAMPAIGAWEPAQSLMRTSQNNSVGADPNKTSITNPASTVNAWQRPLTLSAGTSMPDPRAVGTGKPSSSNASIMNKSTLVPTQPTPEAASPLVTPPALAPIGRSAMSNVSATLPTELNASSLNPDEKTEESVAVTNNRKQKEDAERTQNERKKRREKSDGKRDAKLINKRIMRDTPPRFQSNSRDNDDRKQYEVSRKSGTNKTSNSDSKSRKRSADRQRKNDTVKSRQDVKQNKGKSVEKRDVEETDNVFTNDISSVPRAEVARKSVLSDADKVVGANKPSLKSQSSVGSYTASSDVLEDTVIEVTIKDSYQTSQDSFKSKSVENQTSSEEEEQNAKDTARSVIKSLNDDEERSLETRSLPDTPPLAVKIPEPTLSGPSSDPGRAPSPSVSKNIAPSILHEMNEMNRRLLSARKAWDDTPTTWSDSNVVSSVPASVSVSSVASVDSVPPPSVTEMNIPVSPTKSEPSITTSNEALQKPEDKVSSSVSVFSTKRTEQQVCKVKPQQQLPTEEVKPFQTTTHQTHQLPIQRDVNQASKYTSYVLPVDRQLQQSPLYTSESAYSDQLRQTNQALNFQSLGQVRSVNPSVSPISQQRDMLLSSFPLGSMYNTAALQASQNQLLWQVVSTPNVQPAKTIAYQTHSQGSLFTSPVSIMQYGTAFPPQRNTSNMQRQPVEVMPVPQHQHTQGGRVVGMMATQNNTQVRRDQQYQNLHSSSHLKDASQIALMLEEHGIASQRLTGQQRSDLMKHVHAKPFEPTSQTPPLMQSPPIVAQQSVPALAQQQQIIPTVFSQPASVATHPHHVQAINRYTQQLMSQHQHLSQHNPLVASVRPRSVQGQTLSVGSPPVSLSNQDRLNNVSQINPNVALIANVLGLKTHSATHRSNIQHVHLAPQSMPNQFSHHAGHQQRSSPARSSNISQSRSVGPGPIQRPQGAQPPVISANKTYPPPNASSSNDSDFKKNQRQKMLEDTKRYFEQEQKGRGEKEKAVKEEKPTSTPTANPNLAKHDKFILPDNPKELKRFDYNKKNQRNNSDNYKSSRNPRHGVASMRNGGSSSNGSTVKKSNESSTQQQNKRNASKV